MQCKRIKAELVERLSRQRSPSIVEANRLSLSPLAGLTYQWRDVTRKSRLHNIISWCLSWRQLSHSLKLIREHPNLERSTSNLSIVRPQYWLWPGPFNCSKYTINAWTMLPRSIDDPQFILFRTWFHKPQTLNKKGLKIVWIRARSLSTDWSLKRNVVFPHVSFQRFSVQSIPGKWDWELVGIFCRVVWLSMGSVPSDLRTCGTKWVACTWQNRCVAFGLLAHQDVHHVPESGMIFQPAT